LTVKILSVVEAFCHGGAQTVLVDLVLSLPEHEHRVVHFSRANENVVDYEFVKTLKSVGVGCFDTHWDALRNPESRSKVLEGFRPDIVLFHWWGSDPWMPWVISPQPDRPFIICILHHHAAAKEGYDRYVLVSRSQFEHCKHIPSWRVRVIPNGIDLRRFPLPNEALADEPQDSNRPFVVGRLSELREGKIPVDWIRTLASYRLERARFVIAGNGTLFHSLRSSATDLIGENVISFPGYITRSDVPALLRSFDVFCYITSSAVECCPLAILEAMAAGVPIVAESRGGIPEIVVDGENGLLADSIERVGEHLRRLRDDHGLRRRLSRGARATAEKFSLVKQISAYHQLLAETGPSGANLG
jgi:glycosyltransferase involved in cell wall biosynthesis